jgi:PBP1b-binding outer membrane lipoprotein LpoB
MNSSNLVCTTLVCSVWLVGCSQQETAVSAEAASPTDDPCALITDGDVRQQFPGAASGKRDSRLDQYGIASCTWNSPTNTFIVQLFKAKGSAEDELRSRISGNVDPVKPGAGAKIRYETIGGVGDEAKLAVEKADAQEGILADSAVLVARRGERMAVLFTSALVEGERASTAKALEALAQRAARRL